MNRRDLFKAVIAVPVAGLLGKLLPVEPAVDLTKTTFGVVHVNTEWFTWDTPDLEIGRAEWPNHRVTWLEDTVRLHYSEVSWKLGENGEWKSLGIIDNAEAQAEDRFGRGSDAGSGGGGRAEPADGGTAWHRQAGDSTGDEEVDGRSGDAEGGCGGPQPGRNGLSAA